MLDFENGDFSEVSCCVTLAIPAAFCLKMLGSTLSLYILSLDDRISIKVSVGRQIRKTGVGT